MLTLIFSETTNQIILILFLNERVHHRESLKHSYMDLTSVHEIFR